MSLVATLTQQWCVFQDISSGCWTETWCLVRHVASHRCGASRLPLTLCSHGATVREKHTSSRYIDLHESRRTILILKTGVFLFFLCFIFTVVWLWLLQGAQYWRFENDALDSGYPKPIATGFDGLRGHITAALSVPQYQSRRESVYFFKRGKRLLHL